MPKQCQSLVRAVVLKVNYVGQMEWPNWFCETIAPIIHVL